jgi:hypothetical protein
MFDIEIRKKLIQYLDSEISLKEFQEWFVPATWDIDQSDNVAAQDLAYAIELRLAEYSSGHLPENELHTELQQLVECYTVSVSSLNNKVGRRL